MARRPCVPMPLHAQALQGGAGAVTCTCGPKTGMAMDRIPPVCSRRFDEAGTRFILLNVNSVCLAHWRRSVNVC